MIPGPIGVVIGQKTLVIPVHQGRGDDEIRGRAIAGDGNVPDHRHPREGLNIRVGGLRFERIPEEDQAIDIPVRDPGADLLIPDQWTAAVFYNPEAKFPLQYLAGRPGGVYLVVSQQE